MNQSCNMDNNLFLLISLFIQISKLSKGGLVSVVIDENSYGIN